MADLPISGLTALTGANTASGDLLEIVDVSDTTMAATGTNKKITRDEMKTALLAAPGPIGGTTPAAGSFTTVNASGAITLTGSGGALSTVLFNTTDVGIWRGQSNSFTGGNYLNLGGYAGVTITSSSAAVGSQTKVAEFTSTGLAVTGAISATPLEGTTVNTVKGVSTFRTTNDSWFRFGYCSTPNAWVLLASYNTTGAYLPIVFATSDAEKMRLHASGGLSLGNTTDPGATNLSITGTGKVGTTLGVGGATPSASGAGITFPATQSASSDPNTLDDYEEGTWTPTYTGFTTNSGALNVVPTYTKIGRQITYTWAQNQNEGNISIAAGAVISGLPFTYGVQSTTLGAGAASDTVAASIVSLYRSASVQQLYIVTAMNNCTGMSLSLTSIV